MDKKKPSDLFLDFFYTNTNSLNNKLAELELHLRSTGLPNVFCVTETWFTDKSVPTICGYTLYRRDSDNR